MPANFTKAPPEVVEIAQELIGQYHESLTEANIALLFRDEAPVSGGKVTLGQAKKVPPDQKLLMTIPYDFIIWFAADWWDRLEARQRLAMIDHELQHCYMDSEGNASLAKHDIEEFNCILERHGFWWPGAEVTAQAVSQMPLLERVRKIGRVEAIDPGQVSGLLN